MFKILTIPFDRGTKTFDEEILDKFFLNKAVKSYRPAFFQDGSDSYWTLLVEYDPLIGTSGERETKGLDPEQRMLLERLKAWRKERAEKDGVPVYIVGTNKQLIDMVKNTPRTIEALKAIKGFGKGKTDKYGKEITDLITAFFEKS